MKTHRHGRFCTSSALVALYLLTVCTLLAPLANAAGTLAFVPGELQRQVYTNVPGGRIADLVTSAKFPDRPDLVGIVNSFETLFDNGEWYGERLTGFLVPPVTGDYIFYLSSDDQSVLFLSPDANPTNKVQIAVESGWSPPRSWTGTVGGRTNAANISAPIHLEAGQRYYVEALHKEAFGGDSFGVAWQMPGELPPANGSPPISGQYLGRAVPGLPSLSFQLAFFSGRWPDNAGNVFFRNYTTTGPQAGNSLLPGMRVVTDAGQRYYYAADRQQVLKVDAQTGTAEEMVLGTGVPELSWPMGMTFDSTRNRLLLASLGGEGFLYAYAPTNSQWSLVASMENRDVDSMVYHPGQDALYALEVYRTTSVGPRLYRFSGAGVYQGEIRLPPIPFDIGVASCQSELVSVGDYLFLLLGLDPAFANNTAPQEARMYLIDPRSGQVWLTYQEVVPPAVAPVITQQPASQSVWAGQSATFSVVATGAPLPNYQWQFNGLAIAGATTATLALDDLRATNAGVYTVEVSNPAGSVTSQPATLQVLSAVLRPAPGGQERPAVASNGSLYLVVWADARGTNGWDIYGTRVSPQGRVLDPDGIRICSLPESQAYPAVASDGRDFLVAWHDARNISGSTSYDIYGARVSADGRVLDPNGIPICRAPVDQYGPSIAFNNTNYLLAWYDYRHSDSLGVRNDIYGARVSPQGLVLDPNGLALCTAADMQWSPGVASRGGEFFVAWDDSRRGLCGARVTDAGVVLPPNGSPISPNFSGYPIRVAANPTGYLAVWTDGRDYEGSGYNIYGRRISPSGTPLGTNDLVLCSAADGQVGPAVAAWGNEFLAVWLDDRFGVNSTMICATRIGTGGVLDPDSIPVGRSPSSSSLNLPAAASLNGQYLVVWVGGTSGAYGATDIWAARLSAGGTLLDTNSLLLSTIALQEPAITWPAPAPITYGTALSGNQLNATAMIAGQFVYNPPAGTRLSAGTGQVLSVTFTPADTVNYIPVTLRRSLDVRPAPLAITAENKTKRQGQPNPPLTAAYAGLVAGDTPASLDTPVALSTTATTTSPVGTYPITASGANDPNYTITHVPGTLTVTPLPTGSGSLDLTFDPSGGGQLVGLAQGPIEVSDLAPQADGKLVIAGEFVGVDGRPRARLARLNADGSLDPTFQPGVALPRYAEIKLGIQPNGQILVADGHSLWRLQPDGRPDAHFSQTNANLCQVLALQPDGKIVVAGGNYLAWYVDRLNADGTRDTTFQRYQPASMIRALALQPDGKILAVGGAASGWLVRLNADGTLDGGFSAPAVTDIAAVVLAPGGKILIGGSLQTAGGYERHGVARLNSNGSLDSTFAPAFVSVDPRVVVYDLAVQSDGSVIVGGIHPKRYPSAWDYGAGYLLLLKLRPNGTEDTAFTAQLGTLLWTQYARIRTVALQSDGRICAAGSLPQGGVLRLAATGLVDAGFHPNLQGQPGRVDALALRPNSKALVVGEFSSVAGIPRPGLAQFHPDGTLDAGFLPVLPSGRRATACAAQADGKIVVATGSGPYLTGELLRLHPDGTRDLAFMPSILRSNGLPRISHILIQPDGRILIAGDFDSVNNTFARSFARLKADGSLDPSFDSHGGISGSYGGLAWVNAWVLLPDGKLLVGGSFHEINDTGRSLLARLNPDGSVDTAFEAAWLMESERAIYEVRSLARQPDGKILAGVHAVVDPTPLPALFRLNADGSLDSSFHLGPLTAATELADVNAIVLQSDGKLLVGGAFDAFEGHPQPNLVRLLPDGHLDSAFQVLWDNGALGIATWEIGQVSALALQPDHQVLVGGWFSSIEGQPRWGLARLQNDPPTPIPPAIVSEPADQMVPAGGPATFSVEATGTAPLLFQWQKNGVNLPLATNAILTLARVYAEDMGAYRVRVSNAAGSVLSRVAMLTVIPPPDTPGNRRMPAIAAGNQLYLIAWADQRNGLTNDWDIYAARVTADGRLLDPGGIAVCTLPLLQQLPRVASDGQNFLVVWEDARRVSTGGMTNFDIYGARVTADGRLLDPDGILLTPGGGTQSKPSVAWNGATYLVAWTDVRSGSLQPPTFAVGGARVNPAGTVLDPAGLPIGTATNQLAWPEVSAWNGDFFVAWTDLGQLPHGVYGTRVTGAGNVVQPNGFLLAAQPAGFTPGLAANASGYLMVWPSNPYFGRLACNVRALCIASSGERVLSDLGALRQMTNFLTVADVAASSNEWLAVWMDDRFGPGMVKVWGTRIGPAGVVASNGMEIATMAAPRTWNAPAVASLQGDYLVAWVGPQPGNAALTDIFATRIAHNGTVLDPNGILISAPDVVPTLEITVPPFSQTRFVGQTAAFAVQAGGSPPFTYQWCFQAAPIAGATAATLTLASLHLSNAGPYSVIVSSAAGSVTSPPARLNMLPAPAGPGSLDITFDPTAGGELVGPTQGRGTVKTLALQPDGKLLVGGHFAGLNDKARNNLARLQRDGRLDQSFNPGFGTDGAVDDIAVQPDGRILIVGAFTRFNGEPRRGLARLHPDGSLDISFQPTVSGYPPTCLALQSDGKILIGGSFTNVGGLPRRALARLNPDGTLDTGFDAAAVMTSRSPAISAVALQPDGKVLVAGQFASALDRPLARLNPDGSPDSSFLTPQIRDSSTVGWVNSLALEPSGRILVGGRFLSVNGTAREGLARLNADGALDTTFFAGPLSGTRDVAKVVVQPDGKVLIGGLFLGVNGTVRRGLARLNTDGSLDQSFDPADAVYDTMAPWVSDLVVDTAGCVVVASGLSDYWGRSPHPLCRLNPNGVLDSSFLLPVLPQAGFVGRIAAQADGKVLVLLPEGTSFNGQPCGPLIRLRPDGTLDATFASPVVGGSLSCVLVQPDGRILLGGSRFLMADDTELIGIIRLNSDGSLDTSFQTEGPGEYGVAIYSLALQPDGRILVNGVFDTIRRTERAFMARLNPNGSMDESFQLDTQLHPNLEEFEPPISSVAVQADGKILIGGWFDEAEARLVRLNADGSLDRDLLTPPQTGGVDQIIVQPDGKLLLAGRFNFTNDTQWQTVVRIQANGTPDTVFPSAFNWASSLALQPDGKVLVTVVGEEISLLRYRADGTLDSSFASDIKLGFGDPSLMSVVLQPDGRVLVAGSFSSVSGISCYGLARLNNDLVMPRSFVTRQLPGQQGSSGPAVRLVMQPPDTIAVYALQDQPPAGWLITNISHGGVFDAMTGKVKFGPFFDHDARTLTYDVLPPPGFVGTGLFAGVASADGVSSPITGDDRMVIVLFHPADCHPAEWVMRLDKVTAYGAAWRTGGVWTTPPNPIPIDYVSRAAALWRGGESYALDYNAGAPPLCWVNGPALPSRQAMSPDGQVAVLRRLPKGYLAGEAFEVAIEVSARSGTLAYALEESFPAGWRIQNISHGGAIDALHGQIKWGPFCDATPRMLRYQMVPPAAASGALQFLGSASFDGATTPVGGATAIASTSRLVWNTQPGTGRWVLQLKGERDARYMVETSTDLVQWTALTTVTNSLGQVEIPAPVTSQSQQYYRARLVTP